MKNNRKKSASCLGANLARRRTKRLIKHHKKRRLPPSVRATIGRSSGRTRWRIAVCQASSRARNTGRRKGWHTVHAQSVSAAPSFGHYSGKGVCAEIARSGARLKDARLHDVGGSRNRFVLTATSMEAESTLSYVCHLTILPNFETLKMSATSVIAAPFAGEQIYLRVQVMRRPSCPREQHTSAAESGNSANLTTVGPERVQSGAGRGR